MIELRPHQEAAVKKMHNGCVLCGGVGTGKTITALQYYLENEAPKELYVITTAKKRDHLDWEHEALHVGITPDEDTTMASTITVDSWNNISKYAEVKDAFFIFDEQRLVGSGAWVKAFYAIAKTNRWILLSATPGDTWLDYAPVFIANGFYKNITAFRNEHVEYVPRVKFPKVKRYHNVGKLVRLRNQILVDMPYEKHTTRIEIDVPVEYDEELFRKVLKERWHVYENRPLRDVSELFTVMRKVVYTHSSRLETVRTLLQQHPKLIVFYNFDYELEILKGLSDVGPTHALTEMGDSSKPVSQESSFNVHTAEPYDQRDPWEYLLSPEGMRANASLLSTSTESNTLSRQTDESGLQKTCASFSIAEWNGHKHQPIPKTDSWVYLVQYRAGSEGWNCIDTDAMVFYSPTYSYRDDHQAHGRIDRLNTSFSELYYFRLLSDSIIDKAVMKALRSKQSFNEARFSSQIGRF